MTTNNKSHIDKDDIKPRGYDFPSLINEVKKIKELETVPVPKKPEVNLTFWEEVRLFINDLVGGVKTVINVAKATVEVIPQIKQIMWFIVAALLLGIILVIIL